MQYHTAGPRTFGYVRPSLRGGYLCFPDLCGRDTKRFLLGGVSALTRPTPERVLFWVCFCFFQDNDKDDLYWAVGDGGPPFDPYNKAMDLNSLLGKIIRIRVPRAATNDPKNKIPLYENPPDNAKGEKRPGRRDNCCVVYGAVSGLTRPVGERLSARAKHHRFVSPP